MEHAAVLDVDARTDADWRDITANDGIDQMLECDPTCTSPVMTTLSAMK